VSNVDNSEEIVDKLLEMVDMSGKTVEILAKTVDKTKNPELECSGLVNTPKKELVRLHMHH
jgi:hypothetical protein